MEGRVLAQLAFCLAVSFLTAGAGASDKAPEKYHLRYHFQRGETLRWTVVQRCQIRTSVAGTTQTADTTTISAKAWRVREVKPDGSLVFEQRVEYVDMRHRLSGRDEVRYDSRKDLAPPPGFEQVAQAVGVPLCEITMDAKGKVLGRKQYQVKGAVAGQGELTIVFPDEPVAVGQQWSAPHDIELPRPGGGIHRIKALQTFTLQSVKTGVASIRLATQILTPIHDPAIEALLLQHQSSGVVRFDVDAGRVLGQQMDVDKGVVGFRGNASSIHYLLRFTEEVL
jgi:hypothetical protein